MSADIQNPASFPFSYTVKTFPLVDGASKAAFRLSSNMKTYFNGFPLVLVVNKVIQHVD